MSQPAQIIQQSPAPVPNSVPSPVPSPVPSIEPLRQLVAAEMDAVNREILLRMESDVQLIPQLARHLIASGGKRIRPLLTLGAAQLCGYQGDKQILLAACVEFIHTATLHTTTLRTRVGTIHRFCSRIVVS